VEKALRALKAQEAPDLENRQKVVKNQQKKSQRLNLKI